MKAIDLFAGAGGFTTGAEQAGARVLWAANHWADAVDVHARNHPGTVHACQDLQQADWARVPDCELLLASPACQGHSQAGQPGRGRSGVVERQQADRNTAWAVISAAEVKRPRAVLVENVADFLRWPLFAAWQQALELLGYHVRSHVFDAATFGVPQNRVRAVISAGLAGPIELEDPKLDALGFGSCIDWDAGTWKPWRGKTVGVQKRIRAGRARGLGARFLTHYVSGHPGRALTRPIGCVTTKDQWAVVDGDNSRMLTKAELLRAMDFPETYQLPKTKSASVRMLGNAIPPGFARELVHQTIKAVA